MTFYVGNTNVGDLNGLRVPVLTTATRPASPVDGQVIYNTTLNRMEIYDSGLWKNVVDLETGQSRPFLYRQIITTGYVMGGYKDSSPWRNVNRLNHATDVCTNLGDLLSQPGAYTKGCVSLTKGFLWSCTTAWPGASVTTSAFNLATETSAGLNTNWNMTVARGDMSNLWKEFYYAWTVGGSGGSNAMDVFNMTTEVMSASGVSSTINDSGSDGTNGLGSFSDELKGFAWNNSTGNKFTFATGTGSTITDNGASSVRGVHGQQKGISSKVGKGYGGGNGSWNGGYVLRRWNLTTETSAGADVAKPVTNSGEENFDMGQDRQYMHGCFDGAQNNRGWKFTYATDSGVELGAGSVRTGVPGGSSGCCVWKG
jgi:hypothetical protein